MNDWYIVLFTLIFSAFFSGMEIAFVSSNKLKIELDKNKGLLSAKILAYFVKNPSKILGTLLLGNNIALVIYGISMARILQPQIVKLLGPSYSSETIVLVVQTFVSTLIILITAEFIPKALFRLKSNSILNIFAIPINLLYWIMYPFINGLVGLSEFFIRKILRTQVATDGYSFSHVDLDNYLRELVPDQKEEIEAKQEIQMLQNAISFKSIKLRECMVPRTEITSLEQNESVETLKKTFIETGHSKILIHRENVDDIIGFVHTSEIFNDPGDIKSITRSVPIFPETMLAHLVLNIFIKEHRSIAVVVDEFGGTSGIVTMEDIMEEIFGEIEDEYDTEELIEEILSETSYRFSARHEIDYINEKYNLHLPVSDEYETLGGLIIKVHESIPTTGDIIVFAQLKFVIIDASETRIETVELHLENQ
ncbi:MAG TPA: hemolysin family protein [Bacteroidales bacterium]|nr:HlyC/CorC family transporter [Bacteroidales bacterium]HPE54925.1 hemolysin family protein [Bacteroidales bacterium]HRX97082.1 hemolysin family protein [Bacteroidales bacterium]